jgi:hypothetical protein
VSIRRIVRIVVTPAGRVERVRLGARWIADEIDTWLFAWQLTEQTGDQCYLDGFWGHTVSDAKGRRIELSTDAQVIRRAVDHDGLPLDQDGRRETLPQIAVPTTLGLVTIQPVDRAELHLIREYRAAVERWRDSRDVAELQPFRQWTVQDRRTWRVYRLLTLPDALAELIARGLLAHPNDERPRERTE